MLLIYEVLNIFILIVWKVNLFWVEFLLFVKIVVFLLKFDKFVGGFDVNSGKISLLFVFLMIDCERSEVIWIVNFIYLILIVFYVCILCYYGLIKK